MKIFAIIMTPIRSMRARYVPLLLIYFAYGASTFVSIAESFWVKEKLGMSAEALLALGVWLTVPWTIKMVFGQMVDSFTIFGSNRKVYVYIGALFMTLGTLLMIGLASEASWLQAYSRESVYVLASVISVVGFVMQDVVADTMSTEVVDRSQSEEEVVKELATVQVLGRLALGLSIFIMPWIGGELAQHYNYETIFIWSLFVPLLSILGVIFIRLRPVASSPLNREIFFGGMLFGLFVVLIGYSDVAYAQEIVFVVSLVVILAMLRSVVIDLSPEALAHVKAAMIVIFIYRAMPSVGPGLQWWMIDDLGFDKAFFAKLALIGGGLAFVGMWMSAKFIVNQSIGKVLIFLTVIGFIFTLPDVGLYYGVHTALGIDAHTVALIDAAIESPFAYIAMAMMLTLVAVYAPEGHKGTWFALMASFMNIALSAAGLFSKYLNKIFVITREIKKDGVVVTPANYDELGILLWCVMIIGLVVPIAAILLFNPDPQKDAYAEK